MTNVILILLWVVLQSCWILENSGKIIEIKVLGMPMVSTIYNKIVDILVKDEATTEQEKHVLNVCKLWFTLIHAINKQTYHESWYH